MGEALITRRGGGEIKREYALIGSVTITATGKNYAVELPHKLNYYACLIIKVSYKTVSDGNSNSTQGVYMSVGGSTTLKVGSYEIGGIDVANNAITPDASGANNRCITVAIIDPDDTSVIQTNAWNGNTGGFQSSNNSYVTFETLDTDTIYLQAADPGSVVLKSISMTVKVYGY